jgi:hypothetical protein
MGMAADDDGDSGRRWRPRGSWRRRGGTAAGGECGDSEGDGEGDGGRVAARGAEGDGRRAGWI